MERVIRGRSFTILKTFYADGVAADPTGSPTVTVTRSDGTTVTTGAVTDEPGVGTWSVTVAAAENTLLDTLTFDWAAVVNGVAQEFVDTVEVAGDVLFTVAEARAVKPLDNTTVYTTAAIVAMRTLVEQAMEDAADVAFVPRYYQETFSGNGTTTALLRWPKVTAVRSASIDGTAVSPVSSVVALREGLGYLSTGWTGGYGNVTIGYEHGWSSPPERIRQAALFEARYRLVMAEKPGDDRAVRQDFNEGSYTLHVPGRAGAQFMLPETDAAVAQYSLAIGVA